MLALVGQETSGFVGSQSGRPLYQHLVKLKAPTPPHKCDMMHKMHIHATHLIELRKAVQITTSPLLRPDQHHNYKQNPCSRAFLAKR